MIDNNIHLQGREIIIEQQQKIIDDEKKVDLQQKQIIEVHKQHLQELIDDHGQIEIFKWVSQAISKL